jgi:hypothetical protein
MTVDDLVYALDGFDTDGFGNSGPRLKIVTEIIGADYICRTLEGNIGIAFRRENLRYATQKEISSYRRIYPEVDWYLED